MYKKLNWLVIDSLASIFLMNSQNLPVRASSFAATNLTRLDLTGPSTSECIRTAEDNTHQ